MAFREMIFFTFFIYLFLKLIIESIYRTRKDLHVRCTYPIVDLEIYIYEIYKNYTYNMPLTFTGLSVAPPVLFILYPLVA
jgi:hypothetical protein